MIEAIHSSIYWCVLQVSTTVLLGITIAVLTGTRRAASACSIACVTVVVAVVLTVLAPVSLDSTLIVPSQASTRPIVMEQADTPIHANTDVFSPKQHATEPVGVIGLSHLSEAIQSIVATAKIPHESHGAHLHTLTACLLLAVSIGLARLIIEIVFVLHTLRAATPVRDEQLLEIVERIAAEMSSRRTPRVCVSSHLSDAAATGWLRPTLLLPTTWNQWSEAELRSVIAHEIAHLIRHDASWRAITSAIAAVHSFNPLAHWLLRRVILYQEIAADDLAADAVGPRNYLRALSQLALRRDDQLRRNGRPGLLPVFSGHLRRRVDMLQSKEGRPQNPYSLRLRAIWSVIASTAIVFLGIATCAVRGYGEPSSHDATATPASIVKSASVDDPAGQPLQRLFDRKPIGASVIRPNNTGMLAIRMGELLEISELQPYVPLMNAALASFFNEEFPGTESNSVDLSAIDWIAGQAVLSIRNGKEDNQGLMAFGTRQIQVTLKQPFDLSAWMSQLESKAKRYDVDGQIVYQIPIPAMGPFPLLVSMPDTKTLIILAQNSDLTDDNAVVEFIRSTMPGTPIPNAKSSRWEDSWDRIDGGIGTILFTDAEIYDLPPTSESADELEQKVERLLNSIRLRSTTFAYGFDVEQTTSTIGLRLQFTHSSAGRASRSAHEIAELVKLAQSRNQSEDENLTFSDREWLSLFDEAIEDLRVEIEEVKDGAADVVVTCTLPFDRLVEAYTSGITEEFAAEPSAKN